MPMTASNQRARAEPPNERCANAINAMMPPSPLLSARITKVTYFSDTTISSDQKISESTPRTAAGAGAMPCIPRVSFMVYSGLVPISPKTIPIAPSASALRRDGLS
jgi:hypothetical protein